MKNRDSRLKEKLDQVQAKLPERPPLNKMSPHFIIPLVLFYLVIGVLLVWLEKTVTAVASCVLAVGLILTGLWLLFRYLRAEMEKRIAGIDLAVGSIVLLAGVLLIFTPSYLESVLPSVWGLSLFFGGFLKIQYAFDEKSVGVNRWWIMLIFAAVSLVVGILTLLRSSIFGDQLLAIGIFMMAEAVLDLVTWFIINRGMKKQSDPPAPAAPVPAEGYVAEPEEKSV